MSIEGGSEEAQDARKPRRSWKAIGIIAVVVAVAGASVALTLTGGGGSDRSLATVEEQPIPVNTPGPDTVYTRVGPLEVSPTEVDLGQQPLDKWTVHTFRLRNVTSQPVTVTVDKKSVQVLEGCCPPSAIAGPDTTGKEFVFNSMGGGALPLPATARIEPGKELDITLQAQMHDGMDGPHRYRIKLLVREESGAESSLDLYMSALFI